jgi:hypothetical protein
MFRNSLVPSQRRPPWSRDHGRSDSVTRVIQPGAGQQKKCIGTSNEKRIFQAAKDEANAYKVYEMP